MLDLVLKFQNSIEKAELFLQHCNYLNYAYYITYSPQEEKQSPFHASFAQIFFPMTWLSVTPFPIVLCTIAHSLESCFPIAKSVRYTTDAWISEGSGSAEECDSCVQCDFTGFSFHYLFFTLKAEHPLHWNQFGARTKMKTFFFFYSYMHLQNL